MQSKFSLQSPTFSNYIDPQKGLCKYDIAGLCNDPKCAFTHFKDSCELTTSQTICDLASYYPEVFRATYDMSADMKQKLLQMFVTQFEEQYGAKMSTDEKVLFLWNQLKEVRRARKEPMYACVNFEKRSWYLSKREGLAADIDAPLYSAASTPVYFLKKKNSDRDSSMIMEEW